MVQQTGRAIDKFYQQFPRLSIVITAQADGIRNAMALGRHTMVSTEPPTFGIAIARGRYTGELISKSKEFVVNVMPFETAELVDAIGSTKGREIDKFAAFNLDVEKPLKTSTPILKAAFAAYECRVIDERVYGSHTWFVGEVLVMHDLKPCRSPENIIDLDRVKPLMHMGNQNYITVTKEMINHVIRKKA